MKYYGFVRDSLADPKEPQNPVSGRRNRLMVIGKQGDKNLSPIDEYTGEHKPEAEDAGKVIEVIPIDTGERGGEDFLLEEEDSLDKLALDEQSDAMAERASQYTKDESIAEDFKQRQQLAYGGGTKFERILSSITPCLLSFLERTSMRNGKTPLRAAKRRLEGLLRRRIRMWSAS